MKPTLTYFAARGRAEPIRLMDKLQKRRPSTLTGHVAPFGGTLETS